MGRERHKERQRETQRKAAELELFTYEIQWAMADGRTWVADEGEGGKRNIFLEAKPGRIS